MAAFLTPLGAISKKSPSLSRPTLEAQMQPILSPWSRVSVVTVTHHSAGVIAACLQSVAKAAQVIVVDNASDDDTCAMVRRLLPSAELIENRIGRGFGNGANQGLERVRSEFALLIGPDSTINDESIDQLVNAADRYAEAGLLGPAVVAPDGHIELSHDWGVLSRLRGGRRLDQHLIPEGELCADHLSGAVLLVRMSSLRQVGAFDSNIFLYYEDDDLCLRMRKAGHALILVPQARATHIGGGSSRATVRHVWEKHWHMSWSRLYLESKYVGRRMAYLSGLKRAPKFLLKGLGYALLLNFAKAWRDAARFAGTAAFMVGRKAMPSLMDEARE